MMKSWSHICIWFIREVRCLSAARVNAKQYDGPCFHLCILAQSKRNRANEMITVKGQLSGPNCGQTRNVVEIFCFDKGKHASKPSKEIENNVYGLDTVTANSAQLLFRRFRPWISLSKMSKLWKEYYHDHLILFHHLTISNYHKHKILHDIYDIRMDCSEGVLI